VENYVRLSPAGGWIIQWEDKKILLHQSFECDSTFFKVFDATLIIGDLDPIGQTLTIPEGSYQGESIKCVVNGIMKDFPDNSPIHPEFIATPLNRANLDGWSWIYLLLHKKADPESITSSFQKITDIICGQTRQGILNNWCCSNERIFGLIIWWSRFHREFRKWL